jgi:hypothetical protein
MRGLAASKKTNPFCNYDPCDRLTPTSMCLVRCEANSRAGFLQHACFRQDVTDPRLSLCTKHAHMKKATRRVAF